MAEHSTIEGVAAPLPISNLDTDQIMPKQFLRGIDKAGLDRGLLYDMRFDPQGRARPDFVLNRPEYAGCRILVGGPNFGCGSSREHAVWGLMQFGIRAVVAPSFGEIFYSNAMNNGLLLAEVEEADALRFMDEVATPGGNRLSIDVAALTVRSAAHAAAFPMLPMHHRMFLNGWDLVGASVAHDDAIRAFEAAHWRRQPWLQGVAAKTRARL
ncbi:3-isopropylmalate dehydratase small subunit [Pigmentiphaga soli]|uniref:3-isopropylmalate dehydratase small subunit n=1 Tax=Pigmentiphaga soli TaxID=1007095 RepID=A0ABP8GQQ5_9BURK